MANRSTSKLKSTSIQQRIKRKPSPVPGRKSNQGSCTDPLIQLFGLGSAVKCPKIGQVRVSSFTLKSVANEPSGRTTVLTEESTTSTLISAFLTGGTLPTDGPVKGGENVEYILEAYTKNPQCRVHLKELPREQKVEKVEFAYLKVVRPEVKALHFDVDFCLSLLETYQTEDPGYATILRALNEVINLWVKEEMESIPKARKIIKDALGSLNGEFKHAIYPVGHAHLDTAWLWPLAITKQKMAHTTSTQLSLMERYPEYVFVHSQASQYEWLELEYPKTVQARQRGGRSRPMGASRLNVGRSRL